MNTHLFLATVDAGPNKGCGVSTLALAGNATLCRSGGRRATITRSFGSQHRSG